MLKQGRGKVQPSQQGAKPHDWDADGKCKTCGTTKATMSMPLCTR